MKCPKCQKINKASARICQQCGAHFVRKSDQVARKMTTNARIATASGGVLVFIALVLLLNGIYALGGATCALGAILMVIGKMMQG